MVAVVLGGFSLPHALGLAEAMPGSFTAVHAISMWGVIPPVIASMFATYSMFGFVSLLHALDIDNLHESVRSACQITARIYADRRGKKSDEASSASGSVAKDSALTETETMLSSEQTSTLLEGSLTDLQEHLHRETLEKNVFDTVVDGILSLRDQVQRRIDDTCSSFGGLWLHLVFFSTLQILAIMTALTEHVTGLLRATQYQWWWLLQDFFHLGGGIVLLTTAVGLLCIVTHKFQKIPAVTVQEVHNRSSLPPPCMRMCVAGQLTVCEDVECVCVAARRRSCSIAAARRWQ